MRRRRLLALAGLYAVLLGQPLVVDAVPITVFGTGLDGAGAPLPAGSNDLDYLVLESATPAQVLASLPSTYFPNDASSRWVWQRADGTPTNTRRTFRTSFDLTGLDPTTAIIHGAWAVDNTGVDILVNGIGTGIALPGITTDNFSRLHPFTIDTGFVSGINMLDFIVVDGGVPAAFRAQLSGSAERVESVIPEPSTMTLGAVGLGILFLVCHARCIRRRGVSRC